MWCGLTAAEANGTNRIGVVVQNVGAIAGYAKSGLVDRSAWMLAIPTAAGAVVGSWVAVNLSEHALRLAMLLVFVGTAASVLFRPRPAASPSDSTLASRPAHDGSPPSPHASRLSAGRRTHASWLAARGSRLAAPAAMFAIGIYSGFIQIAVGLVLLAVLPRLLGIGLVRSNAVKVVVIFASQLVSVALFSAFGKIDFLLGGTLAVGHLIGGYVGARLAVTRGENFVRITVLLAALAGSLRLLTLPG